MSLTEQISNEIKTAMKEKQSVKVNTLRQLVAAANNEAIKVGKKEAGLDDAEILKVIKREARKRQDSIDAYEKGGRIELAEMERQELAILSAYLPEQMPEDAIIEIVKAVIAETQTSGPQDFGKVMGLVMKQVGDQADGNVVSKIIKESLSQE